MIDYVFNVKFLLKHDFGQAFMQSPQLMHSAPPISLRTSSPTGQILSHFPQLMQLLESYVIL